MANDNFNAGFGAGTPIGTGEGESPMVANPGSAPSVGVRTMNSDMNSIKTGETPKPYAPAAPSAPATPPPPPAGIATKDAGSGSPSFDLPKMDFGPTTPPTVGAPGSGTSSPSPIPPKKGGKGLFVGIITVIIVVGLAVLGYFVIYPMFFATPTLQTTPPAATNNPAPNTSATPALTAENPVVAPATTTVPATTTESTQTATSSAPAPTANLLSTPADVSLTASTVTTGALLPSLNISKANLPELAQVSYIDQSGNPIGFNAIMQTVFGMNLNSSAVLGNAWNDALTSGLVYVDASGTEWLGFATTINSSASLAAVKSAFDQTFEANSNWAGVFAADPGTAGAWKSGSTAGIANRYLTFSNGESLNYGWSGNTLVISTSYNGFKDILSKL